MSFLRILTLLVALIVSTVALAQDFVPADSLNVDSLIPAELRKQPTPGIFSQIFKRQNKFTTYLDGLISGNEDHTFDKKLDINFIVMPSYTREGSFGIGGGATGLFRLDKTDSIMAPSDVTLIGNVTLNKVCSLSAYGNIMYPGRKLRQSYKMEFTYSPLDFWGISFYDCNVNPTIEWTRQQFKLNTDLVYNLKGPIFLGLALDVNYSYVKSIDDISYLRGQDTHQFFTGLGFTFQYDTRDFIPNPKRGRNLTLRTLIRPQFLSGFDRTLINSTLTFNCYQRLWKGGLLAFDLYESYNSQETPWSLREALGSGGVRMRGYYAGRFVDNCMVSSQLELRQHIYSRFGCAAWFGVGAVFSDYGNLGKENFLPNFGVGLRVELKHNLNGRIDYGMGKTTGGFVFSIGEAF